MAASPAELSAVNTTLLEQLGTARHIRIETKGGSNLEVDLDSAIYRWKSNRGVGQPGKFLILPPGEVATYPALISGTLVADFAINVNVRYREDARLQENPVTVTVVDGLIADWHCDNGAVADFLKKSFARTNATRVGELGFGTNKWIVDPIFDNSHPNERVPGVHLGFGQHNQTDEVAGYTCDIHIDLCAKGGVIHFEDGRAPLDLQSIVPSDRPHPALVSSEDVFSDDADEDCCGMLTQ